MKEMRNWVKVRPGGKKWMYTPASATQGVGRVCGVVWGGNVV